MAVTFEFVIRYLFAELPAHAFVILCLFKTARAVSSAPFQPLFNESDSLFVGIKGYFHSKITPYRRE